MNIAMIVSFANIIYTVRDLIFFFFSSRRRHTRLQGDWSSDVCSSDLRHGPRVRETRKLKLRIHFLNELFVGHTLAPLLSRLEHDGGVIHIERGVIRRDRKSVV